MKDLHSTLVYFVLSTAELYPQLWVCFMLDSVKHLNFRFTKYNFSQLSEMILF